MMVDLAIDVVKATTQFVAGQAWEEISLAWGFNDHLENLKNKFMYYQKLLEVVGKEKHDMDNRFVQDWLQKVKNVAYFADDVMDDHTYEILRREVELGKNHSRKKKVCTFFTHSNNHMVFRFRMTHKVLEILSKFDELDKEAKRIGHLKQMKIAPDGASTSSHSAAVDERINLEQIRKNASASKFVGREKDKKRLLEMMCSPDNNKERISTIAVFGLGGLGKTTLARLVYNEQEKVAKQFEKKMWVCVSKDFNVERILKEMMVELLSLKKCDFTTMEVIIGELQKELKGKKFLLVLDDVWTEDTSLWKLLKEKLVSIEGSQGSVILVTTRSEKVAAITGVSKRHKLEGLCKQESWSLFEQQVSCMSSPFKDIGERIVEKCNGVPLAITTVGGLLQSKESIHDWESIERNEVWATSSSENDPNYILPSLLLSYQHLPSFSLKQCFAYCATFRKDYIMDKNELIDLWIAHGFLKASETSNSIPLTMEDKGEECFKILLDISFLQLEDDYFEMDPTRKMCKCKMHDLVHDLAIHIFQKDFFIWNVKADTSTAFNFRHLVLFEINEDKSKTLKGEKIQQVRTLNIWNSDFQIFKMLSHARYLRSLIMVNNGITEVPPMIEKLKHLRYLDMSSNPIDILPDSICKLYQLQALILLGTKLREIPRELCKLVSLRRLAVSGCFCQFLIEKDVPKMKSLPQTLLNCSRLETLHLENCSKLVCLPGLSSLVSLKHMILESCEALVSLPNNMSNCSRLETLHLVDCPKLVSLPNGLISLVSLKHMKLESCKALVSLPDNMSNCSRLETLHLVDCPKLVSLPNGLMSSLVSLKYMKLQSCEALVSLPDDMFKGLSSLRIFEISFCESLKKIPTSVTECTSLETLGIHDCESLKDPIPDLSKLQGLVRLQINATSSVFEWIPHLPHLQTLNVKLEEHEIENENEIESRKKNNSSRCLSYLTTLLCNGNNDINDTITPPLHIHQSLEVLWLWRSKKNKQKSSSLLPEQLLQFHLPNLTHLCIKNFEELERLPESWISTLSSLEELVLWNCSKLRQLPAKKHLAQLKVLYIFDCPILKERIISAKHDSESEWHNISHLSLIRIDEEYIQDLWS